ncbi:alpha-L-glutamate ligase-like protein [Thalassotalea sp. HSM 43]|uniref:alpha-L-glutamate ligase-like protein n=1 Tax=Thalassotalea sp. HSM 43 TaxID=2552945 RepID=UPI0010809BD1|nr:alpha-L-glutamate ligase-like protein [Thalassotalea sp. HSM 43]QBY03858.1 alpha-L-glutamate ligase-like protein [Thalassotalea sp. HSM 43]
MFDFANPFKLRDRGIMGMNQRNFSYIGRYNDRALYPNVDDKLKTKHLALEHDIAVPDLIGVVRFQYEVNQVFKLLDQHSGFCIKPAKGSGGKGILVILKTDEKGYMKASGEYVPKDEVIRHCSNILAGLFSLGGAADVAVVEALIQFDPIFAGLSHEGVPDLRVIVFQGYPMMSMLRLATHASDGKANLHQGAVGVGINIATGKAKRAVQYDRPIKAHPDTGKIFADIEIHNWDRLLELSAGCFEMSGLRYLGADIVLDKEKGPMVLELNARPGLAIQIANGMGMLPRLRQLEALDHRRPKSVEERVEYAKTHFSD